ncbi:MAG TPA: flavodoxin [Victivallales bacterium]|nr:flavodoxin [Victivallales bacterium]
MSGRIGIIYGSTTGNTGNIAELIKEKIGNAEIINVTGADERIFESYEVLILGTSTWGIGDLQDDWSDSIENLGHSDLTGKKVAIFGLGDQTCYPDSFVDGMKDLYDKSKSAGAEIIGFTPVDEYEYSVSKAVIDGKFLGLPLDEDSQPDKTNSRLESWISKILNEINR